MVVRRTVNAVVAGSTPAPRANVRYRSKDGHQTVNLGSSGEAGFDTLTHDHFKWRHRQTG